MKPRLQAYFVLAFLCRLITIPFSYLRINPYSQADTIGYADHASRIAAHLATGLFPTLNLRDIYDIWGLALSPFWLLPGPSSIYARLVLTIISIFAIYNIYFIATYFHSKQAGIFATLPVAFYPSFVLMHSTLHREATVLFTLTTALRLLVVPNERISLRLRAIVIAMSLAGATILRRENILLYVSALVIGFGVLFAKRRGHPKYTTGTGIIASLIGAVAFSTTLSKGVSYLARVHQYRARGRTAYFMEVVPTNIIELISFSWIGAAYFYFTPFPWMIHTLADVVVGIEAFLNFLYGVAAVGGLRYLLHENLPVSLSLIVAFILASVLYGVADANVGTAVRHRQMFIWILYLSGAIWISDQVMFHDVEHSAGYSNGE